nr:hypothetical protein [Tanacetum cinerariifolium]
MNQNINSSGFDQIQPSQYPVIHHPPQELSEEISQAKENQMKSIQTFLKKFNRISFRETPKVLTQAWEKFFEIQHAQPEDIHEFLHKLLKDLKIISGELAEYINSSSWNRPTFYNDDDEYSIQYKEYLENSSNAIAPVLPTEEPDNSLSMGDEHLSTILEMESDEVIKSVGNYKISLGVVPAAKPDNDDVNMKFLRALPLSWSQVALTLKTRGGLKYLSFDDLYNKLRSLEIDVKGGSSYGSRGTTVAPTHSAFIGAGSTNTKMVYSDQPSHYSLITYTSAHSSSITKDVLH